MKKKQKLFLGFVLMIISVIITMAGCDIREDVIFPNELRRTWKSMSPVDKNTLTFTPDTLKDGNEVWELTNVSGRRYTMIMKSAYSYIPKTIIVDISDISDIDDETIWIKVVSSSSGKHKWDGQWKK
jgi:hypothetical protein